MKILVIFLTYVIGWPYSVSNQSKYAYGEIFLMVRSTFKSRSSLSNNGMSIDFINRLHMLEEVEQCANVIMACKASKDLKPDDLIRQWEQRYQATQVIHCYYIYYIQSSFSVFGGTPPLLGSIFSACFLHASHNMNTKPCLSKSAFVPGFSMRSSSCVRSVDASLEKMLFSTKSSR